jgi:hypothetical protein
MSLLTTKTRVDTLETMQFITSGAWSIILREGRVRRNPGKARGSIRHANQHGVTLTQAFDLAAEYGRTKPSKHKDKAIAAFIEVYNERANRRNKPTGATLDVIDNMESDTREIIRALRDTWVRLDTLIWQKEGK